MLLKTYISSLQCNQTLQIHVVISQNDNKIIFGFINVAMCLQWHYTVVNTCIRTLDHELNKLGNSRTWKLQKNIGGFENIMSHSIKIHQFANSYTAQIHK